MVFMIYLLRFICLSFLGFMCLDFLDVFVRIFINNTLCYCF